MEIIDLPPIAPTLIESTRAIGYSLEAAIADIIDNSIAAQANQIDISFFPNQGAYISILDNGEGMDAKGLTTAMQYGSQNPLNKRKTNDLGRFGLGLKTASLSQCRVLTVASKREGKLEVRRWDIDYVKMSGKWSLISLSSEDDLETIPNIHQLDKLQSGTLVVWQNLDRMQAGSIDFSNAMGKKMDPVREHLSLVYHRYLAGESGLNKIGIKINNLPVEPIDPFLTSKSDQTMQEEVYKIRNSIIKVQPYILPHISKMTAQEIQKTGGKDGLRKLQGFYVYRNKRLLVWGTWFKMMRKGELSKLARIRVDIPNTLDDLWTLDIKKSSAMPPDEVRVNLKHIIEKIADRSKVKFTKRGKIETNDKNIHFWNRLKARDGGYYYEINRSHPMVQFIEKCLGNDKDALYALITQIEKNIPWNQLYLDLNNEEYFPNEKEQEAQDIEDAIRTMLSTAPSLEQKKECIEQLSRMTPFNLYKDVIAKIKTEVLQ